MPTNRSMLQKLLSEETRRLADPQHPGHDMYRQAYGEVESLKAKHGVAPSDRDKDFAASIVVGAKAQGLYQVDHVLLSDDGSKTFCGDQQQAQVQSPINLFQSEQQTAPAMRLG